MNLCDAINKEVIALAKSDALPPFDRKFACSLLYRLLMEESESLSSTCQATVLTVMAMLVKDDLDRSEEAASVATQEILKRLMR